MFLDGERPQAPKAYTFEVFREVGFEDGTKEVYLNFIPADTIEEAVKEAADRNEENKLLRCVKYAMTIEVKLVRDKGKKGADHVNNSDE